MFFEFIFTIIREAERHSMLPNALMLPLERPARMVGKSNAD